MPQRKIPDEPWNLWETPELLKVGQLQDVDNIIIDKPECIKWERSHLLLGTEELFCRKAASVWDRLSLHLPFGDKFPFLWQRHARRELYGQLFDDDSDCPAWIAIIPYRIPTKDRFLEYPVTPREVSFDQWPVGDFKEIGTYKIDLGCNLRLTPGTLLLSPDLLTSREPASLVHACRKRSLIVPGREKLLRSIDYPTYIDMPEDHMRSGDPNGDVSAGDLDRVSAMFPFFTRLGMESSSRGIFTSVTIVLAKMDATMKVHQILITTAPEDAKTAVIAAGRRHLEMYCYQYQDENKLLKKAIRLSHGSKEE